MSNNNLEVFDLSQFPAFSKHSVGFDDMFRRMKQVDKWANSPGTTNAYPPYNIEMTGDYSYVVSLAVSGFGKEDITIETKEGRLDIIGKKPPLDEDAVAPNYIHKGIATRDFSLAFNLADFVEVKSATFKDGLLDIELERVVPEALKPRQITIK